jgi:hypothetical protein
MYINVFVYHNALSKQCKNMVYVVLFILNELIEITEIIEIYSP